MYSLLCYSVRINLQMTVERIDCTGEKTIIINYTNRPTVVTNCVTVRKRQRTRSGSGAMSLTSSVGDSAPGTESSPPSPLSPLSPPAPPLTPRARQTVRNWSESLLNWVCTLNFINLQNPMHAKTP